MQTDNLREVDGETFWAAIGPRDIVSSIVSDKYPYSTRFETRTRQLCGMMVEKLVAVNPTKITTTYYLTHQERLAE